MNPETLTMDDVYKYSNVYEDFLKGWTSPRSGKDDIKDKIKQG